MPYGGVGGNVDINVAPNLNLSAGAGTMIVAGLGYNFGLKLFFTPPTKTFRPRVSAYYGTNTVVEILGSSSNNEVFSGLNLGIGEQLMFGQSQLNGMDFDIMYIATSGANKAELDKAGRVKISVGYRRAF